MKPEKQPPPVFNDNLKIRTSQSPENDLRILKEQQSSKFHDPNISKSRALMRNTIHNDGEIPNNSEGWNENPSNPTNKRRGSAQGRGGRGNGNDSRKETGPRKTADLLSDLYINNSSNKSNNSNNNSSKISNNNINNNNNNNYNNNNNNKNNNNSNKKNNNNNNSNNNNNNSNNSSNKNNNNDKSNNRIKDNFQPTTMIRTRRQSKSNEVTDLTNDSGSESDYDMEEEEKDEKTIQVEDYNGTLITAMSDLTAFIPGQNK
jgi:hypothetical protein